MRLRSIRTFCIVGALAVLAGCDPAALVKSKVPESIQNLLTIDGLGRPDPNKPIATVDLVQPKANSVHGSQDTIPFEAKIDTGKTKFPTPPVISWQLTSLADKKKKPLGSGARVSKKLEPGRYEAEITVEALGKKVSKKVGFRVAHQMPGKVVDSENKGVQGVEIVVTDQDGTTELSRAQSDARGMFKIELPPKATVMAKPGKAGLCFFPAYQTVKFSPTPSPIEFRAIEADISNIRLVESKDPAAAVTGLCPGEPALLSFAIKAKIPPKNYEISLVRGDKEAEQVVRLEQERDTAAREGGAGESQALKVRLPRDVKLSGATWTGHLRITVSNEKGEDYAVDAKDAITVDVTQCFLMNVDRATAALRDGKLEEAGKQFDFAEMLGRQLEDSPTVNATLHKISLNRALALLVAAQSEKPRSQQRKTLVEKANTDLNNLLRHKTGDDQALFLKGLGEYLVEDYQAALKDFDAVVLVRADDAEANLMRAFAEIKTGIKRNISIAIDDLTQVLTADPTNVELRKTRAAALKVVAQYQDRNDDERVDNAEIPVPNFDRTVDLKKYVRK